MRGWILAGLLLAALAAQAGEVHGVEVEARLRDYFFDAARRGDQAMLKEFVEAGFDLDVQDAKGYTGRPPTTAMAERWNNCWRPVPTPASRMRAATPP